MTQISAVISPVSPTRSVSFPLFHEFLFFSQELRKEVGQVQSALIQKLSVLDRYEHVLAQINSMAMERLIDPHTQVSQRTHSHTTLSSSSSNTGGHTQVV